MVTVKTDVIILGAGCNGCGVARDLTLRGVSCALLEKNKIGMGTTWASTRLIHGGLRYLEHMEFGLVRESLREREILLKTAGQFVKPLSFVIPVFDDSPYGRFELFVGMAIYDLLSYDKSLPPHHMLNAKEVRAQFPTLRAGVLGGVQYHDAQIHSPEKLCQALVQDVAHRHEHVKIISVQKKHLWEVNVRIKGKSHIFQAPYLVNTTGPWVDETAQIAHLEKKPRVRTTKGIHILVRKRFEQALYLSSFDKRMFFVIPYGDKTLIGTTDTDYSGSIDDARVEKTDVEYLLEQYKTYFPDTPLTQKDILSSYAGVRPLAFEKGNPSTVSRKHRILEENDCFTVVGGKLTTYRAISQEVTDLLCKQLKNNSPCITHLVPI